VIEFVSSLDVRDVRFATSPQLDGSDAMNPSPDCSALNVEVGTSTGGSWDGRVIEDVAHRPEHLVVPARINRGRYCAPRTPGGGAQLHPTSVSGFSYPDGPQWRVADSAVTG